MRVTSRHVVVAAGTLAVLLGIFLLVRLGSAGPTDEERIRTLLTGTALAVQERRVADAMEAVSDGFRGEGLDKQGVKRFVAYQAMRGEWVRVAIARLDVAVEGDAAEATVEVVLARSGAGERLADLLPQAASAYRIACALAREEAGWRIGAASWRPIPLADVFAGEPAASGAAPQD